MSDRMSLRREPHRGGQRGAALIVCLLMLLVVLMLGTSSAQNALQGEKASSIERDRQIAFQAAEAALSDAELDIQGSPDAARSRSDRFSSRGASGFPGGDEALCHSGESSPDLGLCRPPLATEAPAWQSVDFADTNAVNAVSVPYGKFTGRYLPTGKGALPARSPRYIIEMLPDRGNGESADMGEQRYVYRVTAVGFGARETTQVVLQTFYRKGD